MRGIVLAGLTIGLALAVPMAPVQAAEPNLAVEPDAVRQLQWHLSTLQLDRVHQQATGGAITVAVIDSGVNAGHPDLSGQVLAGRDADARTDVDGRGTGLAGLIAGHGHNEGGTPSAVDPGDAGVLGVAPSARILPVAFAPAPGADGDPDALAASIDYAVTRAAHIICIGRGVKHSAKLRAAIENAADSGVLIIATDADWPDRPFEPWPATYPEVLTAIPADKDGNVPVPPVSGRTTGITVPGVDLITTGVGKGYRIDGGASAAAVLAGAAAVVWSANPDATAAQITQLLQASAVDRGVSGPDTEYGFGALDVTVALADGVRPASPTPAPAGTGSPTPGPTGVAEPAVTRAPVIDALVDSGDWRRWLAVLPLVVFLSALGGWAYLSGRHRAVR